MPTRHRAVQLVFALIALALVLIAARSAVEVFVRSKITAKLSAVQARLTPRLNLTYGDVALDLLARRVTLLDVRLERPGDPQPLTIDRLVVHDIDRANGSRPHHVDVELRGLQLPLRSAAGDARFRDQLATLLALGYERLDADVRLRYRLDVGASRLEIAQLDIDAPDAFLLRLHARVSGFEASRLTKGDVDALLIEQLRIEQLHLDGRDHGLLRRLTTQWRADQPELARLTTAGLNEVASEAPASLAVLLRAAHAFVVEPTALSITIDTKEPVSIGELASEHELSRLVERFTIAVDVPTPTTAPAPTGPALLAPVLDYRPGGTTRVYARDGQLLGQIGSERRMVVELDALPLHLVHAFLAAEDGAFYEHEGVDPTAIFRAVLRNLSAGDVVQGGSAITQQVVKQLIVGPERTMSRKIAEAVLALRLEQIVDKDEILRIYLNQIYLGAGAYGVEAAAQTFFGKPAADLGIAESALIAGLPRAPSLYNPNRSLIAATTRQGYVLDRMLHLGWLDVDQHRRASNEILRYRPEADPIILPEIGAWYLDEVRRRLRSTHAPEQLAGLNVHTALDWRHQEAAEVALRDGLDAAAAGIGVPSEMLQGALVSIEPRTGDVVALVGGRDFRVSQFNRATLARRQPGSAFKPFVYSAAIDAGFTTASVLLDAPRSYSDPITGVVWEPTNFAGRYFGPVTLRTALVKSLNLATVRLAEHVGVEAVRSRARAMGLESELPPYLSISLGSAEVTLIDLVKAYTPFARSGSWIAPRLITSLTDVASKSLPVAPARADDAITAQNAFVINRLLQDVIRSGTATVCAQLGRPAAGKTGTSNDARDAWFIGYTPYLLTGVWVGIDDGTPMGNEAVGGRAAAPIWLQYRQAVEHLYPVEDFPVPPGVEMRTISTSSIGATGDGEATYRLPFIVAAETANQADPQR